MTSVAQVTLHSGGCGGPFAGNFPTIQSAVNAANPGDCIVANAGLYNEGVTVNKTLTIKGAQASNDARTRAGAESIVSNSGGDFAIMASNVVIDGFTIQGQTNPNGAPGFGYAIFMSPGITGTQLLNNIIRNNIIGSSLANTGGTQALIKQNWFDNNNQPGPGSGQGIYTDEFVSGGIVSNVLIDNNKFTNHSVFAIDFSTSSPASASTGIVISHNEFSSNDRAIFLYNINASSFSFNEVHNSAFATSGDVRIFGGVNNFAIKNNNFGPSAPHAIRITDDGGSATSSNIHVNENSFNGYSAGNVAIEVVSGYTGTLDATCDWWGTTDPTVIATEVSGPVKYIPYLTNGTDNNGSASGFQPLPNTCYTYCGNNNDKIVVCHNGQTLCIAQSALQQHLAHGDNLGPCPTTPITMRSIDPQGMQIAPDKFVLANYPNPFNKATRIEYSVPVDASVNIKVYDIMGREVGIVFNGNKSAGSYSVVYNTSKLSSGVYYCRMIATAKGQEFIQTQKLIKAD